MQTTWYSVLYFVITVMALNSRGNQSPNVALNDSPDDFISIDCLYFGRSKDCKGNWLKKGLILLFIHECRTCLAEDVIGNSGAVVPGCSVCHIPYSDIDRKSVV